jgi:hypothetical protein
LDALAREFGYGRDLIARLSESGGSSRHLWSRQYELRAQGKDASRLCSETQDLYASLIVDFLVAAIAGRFNARGLIRGVLQILDPQLFGLSGLQLQLDKNTIELPDGCIVFSIELTINRELECSGISDAPGEVVSKAHGSKLMCEPEAAPSDKEPKSDHHQEAVVARADAKPRAVFGETPKSRPWNGSIITVAPIPGTADRRSSKITLKTGWRRAAATLLNRRFATMCANASTNSGTD